MKDLWKDETALLNALRRSESAAYEELYRRAYRPVEAFVRDNSGTREDARDLFQEALIVLIRKVQPPSFELSGKLGGLLAAIARNIWLKHLRDNRVRAMNADVEVEALQLVSEDELAFKQQQEHRHILISEQLKELEEDCRRVILARLFRKLPYANIAEELGYTVDYVRVKLHKCLKYLRKKVEAHPDYPKSL